MHEKIKIGITQGDINGIGYELILKALSEHQLLDEFMPIIYGSPKVASFYRKMLDIQSVNFNHIKQPNESLAKKVNIITVPLHEPNVEPGKQNTEAHTAALSALERAVSDTKQGGINALVTAPANRSDKFTGHAEYIETALGQKDESLKIWVGDNLKMVIIPSPDQELIVKKIAILNKSLVEDFGIRKPRIAVLATDENENEKLIKPIINQLNNEKIICVGSVASNEFFDTNHFVHFDAVVVLNENFGLKQFNTITGEAGARYTANLPIIHAEAIQGVEYQIAGQNVANEESLRNAIFLVCDIFRKRKEYAEITANPLKIREKDRRGNIIE